jgi:nucleotide-binding universal stress UspA family protein
MKILIPIDSSLASECLLQEVAARPWPEGTIFTLLNVVDVQGFARWPALIEDAKREGELLVKGAAQKLLHAGHSALSEVLLGHPRRAISLYAKEWHADLIMIGSHGLNAIGRFLLGSVAQTILRTAPCSTEIVRSGQGEPVPSSHPMKILLATDGSDCSVEAVHSIARRPWPDGTIFKLLSVEEMIILDGQVAGYPLSSVYPASLLDELTTQARERTRSALQIAKEILQRAGKKVLDDGASPIGEARSVILDTAKSWGANLIVLGSHGRAGLDRFLMGSVAEGVAVHAHCSVAVIRKQSREGNISANAL